MPVLRLEDIYLSLGQFPLLDHVHFQIESGERVTLIGRNGEGKSTLLRIMAGLEHADSGKIYKEPDVKVALLSQSLPLPNDQTVYEVVAEGLGDLSALITEYHHLTLHPDAIPSESAWLDRINHLQNQIEQRNGWRIHQRVERIMTSLGLPDEALMSSLSGGWRRRVGIAQTLVQEPDLLLLDEPTNHLDLDTIQWLEQLLLNYPKSILFITHDRALLRKLATRIIELDRGKLTSYPNDYDAYLDRKQKALEEEERHNALFDKVLAKEEAWVRQGIKARRTRNEGRVRALKALREERKKRRVQSKSPAFAINEAETQGKVVIQAEDISFRHEPDKPMIEHFSMVIQRGDKVALIGTNGAGKTTLLNLLIGNLSPQSGKVKQSPTNQIAYFDQNRAQIDPMKSLIDNVVEGDDFVEYQGQRKHIIGYLGEFLFSPEKARGLAKALSGGETNRLLLAKIFSKPANILVLDEPTNDLDIESLEVLETLILNYAGTVLIISHDREFIDNIATHSVVFEANRQISLNVGGYSDWLEQRKKPELTKSTKETKSQIQAASASQSSPSQKRKLTFKEQRELEALPAQIETLESQVADWQGKMAHPDFYKQSQPEIKQAADKLEEFQVQLSKAYARWEDLDSSN
ncbi:MAG: ATP-binding cassette domain-containing protein [Gammaproteobacteria bacterium]